MIKSRPATVGEAVTEAGRRLALAGIERPRPEARLLVACVLGGDAEKLLSQGERPFEGRLHRRLEGLVARRAGGEPMARILGHREFWSLSFAVGPETLVPRPDSETLVEAALARLGDRSAAPRVLDLGTGSGCLLLALLSELPHARGVGVDISPGALETARRNARDLGLGERAHFLCGNWGEALRAPFDLVLSNPPYVADGDIVGLAPEVAVHEPRTALSGGADGLDSYRAIAPDAGRLLGGAGILVIEVGLGQADPVAAIFRRHGLDVVETVCDLAGIRRCLVISKPWRAIRPLGKAGDI